MVNTYSLKSITIFKAKNPKLFKQTLKEPLENFFFAQEFPPRISS